MMTDAESAELEAGIREAGHLINPIVLLGEQILDGRNRERLCLQIGIEPTYVQYGGPADMDSLIRYVHWANRARRHLTKEDREFAAARAANLLQGGDRRSEGFKGSIEPLKPRRMDAAKYFCVSKPGLARARQVITKGVPELETAVRTGQVSVSAAAEVAARHPPERQREILAAGPAAVTAYA